MLSLLATETISDPLKETLIGIFVGLLFGAFAQSSRFCLRRASIEFWGGKSSDRFGHAMAVWLSVFGAALLGTQLLFVAGLLDAAAVRQLSNPGTMSGAILGGLMFGIGMILARGCASRLLVLSATGNARALLSGLVVTVVAQASLRGVLSPLREALSSLWVVSAASRSIMKMLPTGLGGGLGLLIVAMAVIIAAYRRTGLLRTALSIGLGLTVTLGWYLTSSLAQISFDVVPVGSVTFTGPSADTLMALIASPTMPLQFGVGLVPGVFVGSFCSALIRGEFKIQVFSEQTGMIRYVIGAGLMGFGGMLAGGCAVGAGITGGAVMSSTAWIALFCMWVGAAIGQKYLRV